MRLERITAKSHNMFERAFYIYESSFAKWERRGIAEQDRVLLKSDYHFDVMLDNDELIGIMLYWELDSLIFLEHFAVIPKIERDRYGAKALDLLKTKNKKILVEIEASNDEVAERRYNFYIKNQFCEGSFNHIKVKYNLGDKDIDAKIMSYPNSLTNYEYQKFCEYVTREIGIRANKSEDVHIRPIKDDDDLNQVAKLIYLTDQYIYPYWFDNIEQAARVIVEMISLPTLYNKKNILAAVTKDNYIAGIIVSKQAPFAESFENIKLAFKLAGEEIDERSHEMFEAYYKKMGSTEDAYYIANVSVDPLYRKRGIAAALVENVLSNGQDCSLECVVKNAGAVRLYQRMGFEIAYEYPGVHDVPCYKMYYRGKK